jgi:hypothetical protein
MTETSLRDLERELEAIYAQEQADTPADWNALTARQLELSQHIATAPIGDIDDARRKLRLARRLQQYVCADEEDLLGYEGIVLRCIREVSEWFEGTPSAPEAGAVLLSAAAAAQIRAALLAALQHHGGDLEEADEPGLDERTRNLEAQLRAALRLLDQAAPAREPTP